MSESQFSDIKEIVRHLKKEEVTVAKRFLVAFDSNVTRNQNKGDQLFRAILAKPHITYEQARVKFHGTGNKRSFDRLLLRLKEKIIESLLLDVNIKRTGAYSDWYRSLLTARKNFMIAFTLFGRGLTKQTRDLYDKIIVMGQEFELYDELIEVIHWRKNDYGIISGPDEFHKFDKDLEYYKKCREALYNARNSYYEHYIENVDYKGLKENRVGLLTEALSKMQHDYKTLKSDFIGYFLYRLLTEYHAAYKEYHEASLVCRKLIDLISNSKAVYMGRRLANAYSDLALYQMLAHMLTDALNTTKTAKKLRTYGEFNYTRDLEYEVIMYIHLGNYDKAARVNKELLELTDPEESAFHFAMRTYLNANIAFLKGEYQAVIRRLNQTRDLEPDREGWGFGIRLLALMTTIEQEKFDLADNRTENLRKYIKNTASDVEFRERDMNIFKVMTHLSQNSYNFKATQQQDSKLFQKLESGDDGRTWEVKTPEVIVFHEWFKTKVLGAPYNHTQAIKNVEKACAKVKRKASPALLMI